MRYAAALVFGLVLFGVVSTMVFADGSIFDTSFQSEQKILSAIIELKTSAEELRAVLHTVTATARRLDTVVAVGVATRCSDDGNDTVLAPLLAGIEIPFERAKTNMGLGRTTNVA